MISKRDFRILKNWKIRKRKRKTYSGFVSFGEDKTAVIYDWIEDNKPEDFELHEFLHCALRELLSMDKRKIKKLMEVEEELIQDICKIYREKEKCNG
jgi:hypothetical protein